MTTDDTFPIRQPGDSADIDGVPSDLAGLASGPSSAIVRLIRELSEKSDFFYQIGWHRMDRDELDDFYGNFSRRRHDSRHELIKRARHQRTQPSPHFTSWDDPPWDEQEDAIRSRLDLPTFIARHAGHTAVGFRRLDDVLICPCPLPDDPDERHVDAWLYVDPLDQTWFCTGCEHRGDILTFASCFSGLQHEALWTFMAREAGLTLQSTPYE